MEEQCKAKVWPNDRWDRFHPHQCYKKAVKDGYCTIHHPNYKKEKDEKRTKKWEKELSIIHQMNIIHKAEQTLIEIADKYYECPALYVVEFNTAIENLRNLKKELTDLTIKGAK
jgi:hypothetical protein